ncbi:MAG: hypothetical protein M3362_22710, partial [Acidobacteriota bacterium]|nr:hypothetical protein [Acidobacteriota bacterium]
MSSNPTIEPAPDYVKIIERYTPFFDRPEARIRFLKQTLAILKQESSTQTRRRLSFLEGTRFDRWLLKCRFYSRLFSELRGHLPKKFSERRRFLHRIEPQGQIYFRLYLIRHFIYGVSAALALAALFGLYAFARWSVQTRSASTASVAARVRLNGESSRTSSQTSAAALPVTNKLPGYQPEKVWLVERKSDYELYSNGARILLDNETDTRPRAFRALARATLSPVGEVRHDPVGIVYHTSEND